MKKRHTPKRKGFGLEIRTFKGDSGEIYVVFRTPEGSFHAFVEVEAKAAAKDCRAKSGNTRQQWQYVWDQPQP